MAVNMSVKSTWEIVKQTFSEFMEDKCPRLGASLAYYTVFSIAPLLIIVVGILGIVTHGKGLDTLRQQLTGLMGPSSADIIAPILKNAGERPQSGIAATVIGIVTLLFGAAGVFGELQDSLNTVWDVTPKPGRGVIGMLRDRFLSFAMVGGVCFLLLVSLVVTTVLEGANHWLSGMMPGMKYLWMVLNLVVSLGVITLLFAMIYKILPDVKMAWKDVWLGAVVTAVLFVLGKWALGLYLGKASIGSVYGAAGSLVVLLAWIYYSAQIFLLGAEFVQVWAKQRGHSFTPDENAIPLTAEARAAQGIPKSGELQAAAVKSGKTPTDADMPSELVGLDLEARREMKRKQRDAAAAPSGKVLPITVGFALGFFSGRLGKKQPPKMVLSGPVRLIRRKRTATGKPVRHTEWGDVMNRLKAGWQSGVNQKKK